jgi:hypothetical protein
LLYVGGMKNPVEGPPPISTERLEHVQRSRLVCNDGNEGLPAAAMAHRLLYLEPRQAMFEAAHTCLFRRVGSCSEENGAQRDIAVHTAHFDKWLEGVAAYHAAQTSGPVAALRVGIACVLRSDSVDQVTSDEMTAAILDVILDVIRAHPEACDALRSKP